MWLLKVITMFFHQKNSDQAVYGIEKNNITNEVWCCYFNEGDL